jgi:hypothetical protein
MPASESALPSNPPIQLTIDQVRWQRFQRAGLVKPFADATAAASALFGVQAQFHPAGGLSIWNRTPTFSHAEYDSLLLNERTLVKLWGQRHTLHVYASEDWPLLYAARRLNNTWWERQAARDAENGKRSLAERHALLEQVAELLRSRESLGRRDLRDSGLPLDDDMLSPWGGIFSDLVQMGYACHYARSEGEGRFVARERWLPDLVWEPPDPAIANTLVLQRYLDSYGPATLHDFGYWRGIATTKAKAWFQTLAPELVEVQVNGQTAYLPKHALEEALLPPPPAEAWPVRMLYRFDAYLLGHHNKDWVIPPAYNKTVIRPAGHIEGIVVVKGQAAGTWRYDRKGSGLIITVYPYKSFPKYVLKQVEKNAKGVAAYFDVPLQELIIKEPGQHLV